MAARSLVFCLLLAGCGGVSIGDDDDGSPADDDDFGLDDDDAAGDDDDATGADDGPSYPSEEAFFGFEVGNRWRYLEVVSGDITPVEDDVLIEIRNHVRGDQAPTAWDADMGAWELKIDRLDGQDVTHWYGLDGTGALKWLHTTVHLDFFETDEHPGDGSVVMLVGSDEESLLGATFDAAWFLADLSPNDYSTSADTIETFMYGAGKEVEALGLLVREDDDVLGLQYFKAGWGLLGQDVEIDGQNYQWTIIECTACPPEAGL